jgi:hypothetical protein
MRKTSVWCFSRLLICSTVTSVHLSMSSTRPRIAPVLQQKQPSGVRVVRICLATSRGVHRDATRVCAYR